MLALYKALILYIGYSLTLLLFFCNVSFASNLKKRKIKNVTSSNNIIDKKIDSGAKKPNITDLDDGIVIQTKIMPPEGRLIGNIILEARSQFDLRGLKNKYIRQICSVLKFFTPSIDTETILSRLDFSEEPTSIIEISSFLPNANIKDQRSLQGSFTNNRIDIRKLKFAKNRLDELKYISEVIIILQDNPIDNTYVDIKVSFKNLFPIMVNPFNYSLKCTNFLGTGHIIAFKAFPKYVLLDGYEISYITPNIYNTNITGTVLYEDTRFRKAARIELIRPFLRFTRFGGGAFKASTYQKIDVLGSQKKSYDFKYNSSSLWLGKTVDIWSYSYDEYYKRLIFTMGLSNCYYIEAPLNLKKYDIPITNNKEVKGAGVCLLKNGDCIMQDIRGRGKERLWKGYKIYVYGGYIAETHIMSRKYMALNLGNGLYLPSLGYMYFNTELCNITDRLSDVHENRIVPAIKYLKGSMGYISEKCSISNIKLRQIIGLNYEAFFGGTFKSLSKIDGFFNYIDKTIHADLRYKIALGIETILYNPIEFYGINVDPFLYIENLFFKANKFSKGVISKNIFSIGGGLLLSAFEFVFQLGAGIIKESGNNIGLSFNTILQTPILTTGADISVISPTNITL